jgi:aminoglycoside phosphotransferase (APT) family kinase protein
MRKCTRIKESTRLTQHNVRLFLRRYAKHIPFDQLELIEKGPYGASFTFYYGKDKILKVNKVKARQALLKEAALNEYLGAQQLPFAFASPLEVHPKGFYAVYSRLDASGLNAERVKGLSAGEVETFSRTLAEFLSFLHTHDFPDKVLSHIPREEEDLSAGPRYLARRIRFIREYAPSIDVTGFEEEWERLRGSFEQVLTVTHTDFSMGNILLGRGGVGCLAFIDFTDAEICDPSIDFSCLAEDLEDEGVESGPIVKEMLKHYAGDGDKMQRKIEFRLLFSRVSSVFRKVRMVQRRAA